MSEVAAAEGSDEMGVSEVPTEELEVAQVMSKPTEPAELVEPQHGILEWDETFGSVVKPMRDALGELEVAGLEHAFAVEVCDAFREELVRKLQGVFATFPLRRVGMEVTATAPSPQNGTGMGWTQRHRGAALRMRREAAEEEVIAKKPVKSIIEAGKLAKDVVDMVEGRTDVETISIELHLLHEHHRDELAKALKQLGVDCLFMDEKHSSATVRIKPSVEGGIAELRDAELDPSMDATAKWKSYRLRFHGALESLKVHYSKTPYFVPPARPVVIDLIVSELIACAQGHGHGGTFSFHLVSGRRSDRLVLFLQEMLNTPELLVIIEPHDLGSYTSYSVNFVHQTERDELMNELQGTESEEETAGKTPSFLSRLLRRLLG